MVDQPASFPVDVVCNQEKKYEQEDFDCICQ